MKKHQVILYCGEAIFIALELIALIVVVFWRIISIISINADTSYVADSTPKVESVMESSFAINAESYHIDTSQFLVNVNTSNFQSGLVRTIDLEVEEPIQTRDTSSSPIPVVQQVTYYYSPTEEERQWTYKLVYAEAGTEDALGQIYVANVIINRAILYDIDLIEVSLQDGQFSCMHRGVPCVYRNEKWIPVTDDMISDELKTAVDSAFEKDYTEELLREIAQQKNLGEKYYEGGALFFYNPRAISDDASNSRSKIKVLFQHGGHNFYRFWDK